MQSRLMYTGETLFMGDSTADTTCRLALESTLDASVVSVLCPMRVWPDKTNRFPDMAIQDMCQ
jgi:hypothetical protein